MADGKEGQAWASQRQSQSSDKHLAQGQCGQHGYHGCPSAAENRQPLRASACPSAQVHEEGWGGEGAGNGAAGAISFEKGWAWT